MNHVEPVQDDTVAEMTAKAAVCPEMHSCYSVVLLQCLMCDALAHLAILVASACR